MNFLNNPTPTPQAPFPPEEMSPMPAFNAPRSPRRKRRVIFFATLGVCVGILVVASTLGATRLFGGSQQASASLADAETALKAADFGKAADALQSAKAGVVRAQSGLALLVFARPLPFIGTQLKGTASVLDAVLKTVDVLTTGVAIAANVNDAVLRAHDLLGAANTAEGETFDTMPEEERVALLTALHRALPDLRDMRVQLKLASADLDALDALHASSTLTRAVEPLRSAIPLLQTGVDVLVPLAATVDDLAGVTDERQFLLLFLNNSELRPGGGFIGVVGLSLMNKGSLESIQATDVYAIDNAAAQNTAYHVNPPSALATYLGVSSWFLRDAAWSPSFPDVARDARTLLRQEAAAVNQPVPDIHGVIGITPSFVSRLLTIVGPISVGGQTFDAANIADAVEYSVEIGYAEAGAPDAARKDIVGTLMNELIHRVFSLPTSSWPILFTALREGFVEKEVAIASEDESTQAALVDAGWAGSVDGSAGDDVLMVVDANMASLKTDTVMNRHVTYHVEPKDGGFIATTTIDYTHTGGFDWKTTRYRTYARVFVPLGSTLVSVKGSLRDDKLRNPTLAPGDVTTENELGMTSFGAFTSIEPGTTGTLAFTYRLPDSVAEAIAHGAYDLNVFKQMGAQNETLTVDMNFGKKLRFGLPAEDVSAYGDMTYHLETDLDTNRSVTIGLE